jgi:hypothetical protein
VRVFAIRSFGVCVGRAGLGWECSGRESAQKLRPQVSSLGPFLLALFFFSARERCEREREELPPAELWQKVAKIN